MAIAQLYDTTDAERAPARALTGASPVDGETPCAEALWRSALSHHHAGDHGAAEGLYRHLLGHGPERSGRAILYSHLGAALRAQARLEEAVACYRLALASDPNHAPAHNNLGIALMSQGQLDQAIDSFRRAVALAPGDADTFSNLGFALCDRGRWLEAAEAAKQAVRLDGGLADPWHLLGMIFQRSGDAEQAVTCFRRSLALDPDDSNGAGLALAHLGAAAVPDRPSAAYLQRHYAHRAVHWDRGARLAGAHQGADRIRRALDALVGSAASLQILDAGCGTGLCGSFLRPLARRLVGVDLSAPMIARAEEKGLYDQLVSADLVEHMRAHVSAYDLVVGVAVLIHFGELASPFAAAWRTLRPRGLFAFSLFERDRAAPAITSFFCHAHSEPDVAAQAQATGFAVLRMERIVREYHDQQPVPGLVVVLERIGAAA